MWKPAGGSISAFSSSAGTRVAAATAVICLLLTGMLVVTVGHPSSGDPVDRPAAATGGKVFSAYFRKLTRERRAINGPLRRSAPPGTVEHLSPSDLFIAVKTTGRYHGQRLELLLDTWISRNMQQVSRWRGIRGYLVVTNNSTVNVRWIMKKMTIVAVRKLKRHKLMHASISSLNVGPNNSESKQSRDLT